MKRKVGRRSEAQATQPRMAIERGHLPRLRQTDLSLPPRTRRPQLHRGREVRCLQVGGGVRRCTRSGRCVHRLPRGPSITSLSRPPFGGLFFLPCSALVDNFRKRGSRGFVLDRERFSVRSIGDHRSRLSTFSLSFYYLYLLARRLYDTSKTCLRQSFSLL